MTRPRIEPRSPGPYANTLPTRSICRNINNNNNNNSPAKLDYKLSKNVQNIRWSFSEMSFPNIRYTFRKKWKPQEWNRLQEGKVKQERKSKEVYSKGMHYLRLLCIIMTMPLNHILRKSTAAYKLSKSLEKIKCTWTTSNCLQKMKKRIVNSNTRRQNIQ